MLPVRLPENNASAKRPPRRLRVDFIFLCRGGCGDRARCPNSRLYRNKPVFGNPCAVPLKKKGGWKCGLIQHVQKGKNMRSGVTAPAAAGSSRSTTRARSAAMPTGRRSTPSRSSNAPRITSGTAASRRDVKKPGTSVNRPNPASMPPFPEGKGRGENIHAYWPPFPSRKGAISPHLGLIWTQGADDAPLPLRGRGRGLGHAAVLRPPSAKILFHIASRSPSVTKAGGQSSPRSALLSASRLAASSRLS